MKRIWAVPEGGRRKTPGTALPLAFRRPLRGLPDGCSWVTHSSASLHCGLYSVAPSGGFSASNLIAQHGLWGKDRTSSTVAHASDL